MRRRQATVKTLHGYQGFSPYADPATGFEQAYEERYAVSPTFAECKKKGCTKVTTDFHNYGNHCDNGIPVFLVTTAMLMYQDEEYKNDQDIANTIAELTNLVTNVASNPELFAELTALVNK